MQQLLESHNMCPRHISDEVLTSKYTNLIGTSSPHALGWSFSDSVCSLFTALGDDSTFHRHFCARDAGASGASKSPRDRFVTDPGSCDVTDYVLSKIMPSSSGSIEHLNIMYWKDRFQMCQCQEDAVAYDEAKKSEHRALIWPYIHSSYNDVSGFCSHMSLYLLQVRPLLHGAHVPVQITPL